MPSMQENLIESLVKDLKIIEELSDKKNQRKEYALILKRIESAKKLFQGDDDLLQRVIVIEKKLRT